MQIFQLSRRFPPEERYALTDQIRRSSRSVATNITEAYRKRRYPALFINKLTEADAEGSETQVWLDFAKDCEYLREETRSQLVAGYEEAGRMLGEMIQHPERFAP